MNVKIFKKLSCYLIIIAMVVSGLGISAAAAVAVESVSLSNNNLTLVAGDTVTLTASVVPPNADNKAIRFASSNPYITLSNPSFDAGTGITSVTVQTTRNTEGKIIAISEDGNKVDICDMTVGDILDPGVIYDRTKDGGTPSASGENAPNETALKAFDQSYTSKWLVMTNTAWLQFKFNKPYYITKYALVSGNSVLSDGRDPKSWVLKASNDGQNWDTMDTRTNEEFNARRLKRIFDFNPSKAYQYFRLEITENAGGALTELTELQLLECGPDQPWTMGPFEKIDESNPILSPNSEDLFHCPVDDVTRPWTDLSLYNPGAIMKDGTVHLFYRAQDNAHMTSRVGHATSTDGVNFTKLSTPAVYPDNDEYKQYEWTGGCEDPRVIEADDGTYYMYYTAYFPGSPRYARLMVATSTDLYNWTKRGLAFLEAYDGRYVDHWSKAASIVSEYIGDRLVAKKINGKYWMYWGDSSPGAFLATSEDLINWYPVEESPGNLKVVLPVRRGNFDAGLCEPGPAAIYTDYGILLIYNGRNGNPTNGGGDNMLLDGAYCPGQALFDPKDPSKLIDRTPTYFMYPEKMYEISGLIGKVCFIEGLVHLNDKWYLYYGTADSYLAVAVYDPAKWEVKPKENTLALDKYDMNLYTEKSQKLTAKVTLEGGGPGAKTDFICTNDDIKISDINYNSATGETTMQVSSSVAGEGMIIALASDSSDAMICNVKVNKSYDMNASFKSEGKVITTAQKGDISFEVKLESNVDISVDARPIIALYKNEKLVDFKMTGGKIDLTAGILTLETDPINIPSLDGIEEYTIKAFIWDSELTPLTSVYTLGEWTPENPNLALKRPSTASSYAGDGPLFNSNDGDRGTYWTPAQNSSGDIWYTVDLGFDARIDKVIIRWGSPFVTSYRIETATSADPNNFKTVKDVTGGTGGNEEISFEPETARYVRFYYPAASTSTGYRVRFYEFEVYGAKLQTGEIKLVQPYDVDVTSNSPVTVQAETYGYYGAVLNFSVENLPSGADFDEETGLLTWTPQGSHIGTHNITFKVSNGITEDQKTFKVNVKPVNLALNKTATSSSNDSNEHLPRYAVDGNTNTTRWASNRNNNEWLMVDLGAEYDISRVVLNWEAAYGRTYRIEYATAAAPNTWLTATTNNNGVGGIEELTFTSVNARYVRMYGLTRATTYGFSLFEFEIYEQ